MVGYCDETRWNSCGMCEYTVSPKYRGGNMLHLMQLQFRTVHTEICEKEHLLDHWCHMSAHAPILSPQIYHCEVTSIYQKWDFPLPPPHECIGLAETLESTQAHTPCQSGETQGKTVLLRPQKPCCLLLL